MVKRIEIKEGVWWNSLNSILKDVNEEDILDLKYSPLTHITLQNMKYDTLYIIKDTSKVPILDKDGLVKRLKTIHTFWAFVKIAKYFHRPGFEEHMYYNEDGYSITHFIFIKESGRAAGGVLTWSQSEVEGISDRGESLRRLVHSQKANKIITDDVYIAEFGSSFFEFINWTNRNPMEVKE